MKSEQMPGAGFSASGIKHLGDRKLVILMTVLKRSPVTAQEIINTHDRMSDEELEALAPWNENVKAEIEKRTAKSNQ